MPPFPRIVSLLPSSTEIVAALGFADALVGRSHECDVPRSVASLPVCTAARLDSDAPGDVIDREVREVVNAAAEFAQNDPEPAPSELWTDVLVEA